MNHENEMARGDSVLEVKEPAAELELPGRPLKHADQHANQGEHAEKGSFRSMWELLMQLRVLLPYLSSLVPLLDRGLSKIAPDLSEVRKGIGEMQAGSRDLGIQARNQMLRIEQIEVRLGRLAEAADESQRQGRDLAASLLTLTRWVRALAILTGLLFVLLIVVATLQLSHLGH
jgi:hypothetical protein